MLNEKKIPGTSARTNDNRHADHPAQLTATHEDIQKWRQTALLEASTLAVLVRLLPDIAQMVEQSTAELSSKFMELAHKATEQGAMVQRIVEMLAPLAQPPVKGDQLLLSEVEDYIHHVQDITGRISLLTGGAEHGEVDSFEVTALAGTLARLSGDMHTKIGKRPEVAEAEEAPSLPGNMPASKRLEQLMECMLRQNSDFSTILQNAADNSNTIATTISSMIVSMQFQDRVSQYLGNSTNVLKLLQDSITAQAHILDAEPSASTGETGPINPELAKHIADTFKLTELQQLFVQQLLDEGYIQTPADINCTLGSSEAEESDDGDIELF